MNNTHPKQQLILHFILFIELFLCTFHCLSYVFKLLLYLKNVREIPAFLREYNDIPCNC